MAFYTFNKKILAATHAVAAVQAFIASAVADGNVTAGIAGGGVSLHAFSSAVYSIQTLAFNFNVILPVGF
jgi:hypothetical protein